MSRYVLLLEVPEHARMNEQKEGKIMNEEITMKDILVAINEMAADTSDIKSRVGNIDTRVGNIDTRVGNIDTRVGNIDTRVGNIETKVGNIETRVGNIEEEMQKIKSEMKEMRAEFKTDIRRVDKKFELVLKDLYETKTDISMLEKEVY